MTPNGKIFYDARPEIFRQNPDQPGLRYLKEYLKANEHLTPDYFETTNNASDDLLEVNKELQEIADKVAFKTAIEANQQYNNVFTSQNTIKQITLKSERLQKVLDTAKIQIKKFPENYIQIENIKQQLQVKQQALQLLQQQNTIFQSNQLIKQLIYQQDLPGAVLVQYLAETYYYKTIKIADTEIQSNLSDSRKTVEQELKKQIVNTVYLQVMFEINQNNKLNFINYFYDNIKQFSNINTQQQYLEFLSTIRNKISNRQKTYSKLNEFKQQLNFKQLAELNIYEESKQLYFDIVQKQNIQQQNNTNNNVSLQEYVLVLAQCAMMLEDSYQYLNRQKTNLYEDIVYQLEFQLQDYYYFITQIKNYYNITSIENLDRFKKQFLNYNISNCAHKQDIQQNQNDNQTNENYDGISKYQPSKMNNKEKSKLQVTQLLINDQILSKYVKYKLNQEKIDLEQLNQQINKNILVNLVAFCLFQTNQLIYLFDIGLTMFFNNQTIQEKIFQSFKQLNDQRFIMNISEQQLYFTSLNQFVYQPTEKKKQYTQVNSTLNEQQMQILNSQQRINIKYLIINILQFFIQFCYLSSNYQYDEEIIQQCQKQLHTIMKENNEQNRDSSQIINNYFQFNNQNNSNYNTINNLFQLDYIQQFNSNSQQQVQFNFSQNQQLVFQINNTLIKQINKLQDQIHNDNEHQQLSDQYLNDTYQYYNLFVSLADHYTYLHFDKMLSFGNVNFLSKQVKHIQQMYFKNFEQYYKQQFDNQLNQLNKQIIKYLNPQIFINYCKQVYIVIKSQKLMNINIFQKQIQNFQDFIQFYISLYIDTKYNQLASVSQYYDNIDILNITQQNLSQVDQLNHIQEFSSLVHQLDDQSLQNSQTAQVQQGQPLNTINIVGIQQLEVIHVLIKMYLFMNVNNQLEELNYKIFEVIQIQEKSKNTNFDQQLIKQEYNKANNQQSKLKQYQKYLFQILQKEQKLQIQYYLNNYKQETFDSVQDDILKRDIYLTSKHIVYLKQVLNIFRQVSQNQQAKQQSELLQDQTNYIILSIRQLFISKDSKVQLTKQNVINILKNCEILLQNDAMNPAVDKLVFDLKEVV